MFVGTGALVSDKPFHKVDVYDTWDNCRLSYPIQFPTQFPVPIQNPL